VSPGAREAKVSRSWLYNQSDLRAEIERLRDRRNPSAAVQQVPDRQRASDASLRSRLDLITQYFQGHRQVVGQVWCCQDSSLWRLRQDTRAYRYPIEIIGHAVWLYHRFALTLRDVEELMLARGVVVTYETIRSWCAKFGPDYANQLRRRRPRPGDKWHLDEVFIKINGTIHYLWRAVDQHGNVLGGLRFGRPGRVRRGGGRWSVHRRGICAICRTPSVTPPAVRTSA
jgi:hypothetical protein